MESTVTAGNHAEPGEMVSGTDPYGYKGIEDVGRACVRQVGPTRALLAEAAEHAGWNAA